MVKTTLNNNLHKAHRAKKDEFYTQLVDIEKELKHYKEQFRNKVVYCNCDDPFESNFFKYFASNFNALGLKQLIATSYKPSPIANTQLSLFGDDKTLAKPKGRPKVTANKFIINEVSDLDGDGAFDLRDIAQQLKANKNNEWTPLKYDGDFRSEESVELLKQADIVVTNPPFSLFREYVAQLVEYNKKFLILGDQNAITYKETFKLIKEDKLWLGYDNGGTKWFQVPMDYDIPTETRKKIVNGVKYFSMGRVVWFTNLDTVKRQQEITLYKKYSKNEYPEYDNYEAINVNKVSDIPMDYKDAMGVPVTFLDKYNPSQFQIISSNDIRKNNNVPFKEHGLIKDKDGAIKGKPVYVRIVIKNKKPQK
ncbi:MAG: modification methylase [Candidatus Magasanikbacteria bacterium CG_4_10_14_0_2_um_filter_37_12]|uniref:Modification methylase n=1 Tax=Candidatus Magasanikbacteria bacterium CG_4_10_14_0_2_um_filter_37_12 TaxID=1974637 RepID=A0A2M7V8X2_9BACT|nr:MAG: modification methylase [Candidatus Magasanikbacteria bacterium CG_4_10_14_0_2_um_filter_37_12]